MQKISPHLVDTIQFSNIKDIINIPSSKKVINITNCDTLNSALDHLISNIEKLPENIFILVFTIDDNKIWTFDRQKLQKLSEILQNSEIERIFVFQTKFKTTKFLCKIKNQNLLTKIELSRGLYEDEFANSLILNELIFKAIISSNVETGICGAYRNSFSDVILDTNRNFMGLKLIDYTLINFDSLSLKFLLLFGVDLSLKNENNERPLETAVKCGNFDGFLEILESDAKNLEALVLIHEPTGFDLVMLAAENGNSKILQFLLQLNIFNVNSSVSGMTPLKLAIKEKKFEAVEVLLEHDAAYDGKFLEDLENFFETRGDFEVKDTEDIGKNLINNSHTDSKIVKNSHTDSKMVKNSQTDSKIDKTDNNGAEITKNDSKIDKTDSKSDNNDKIENAADKNDTKNMEIIKKILKFFKNVKNLHKLIFSEFQCIKKSQNSENEAKIQTILQKYPKTRNFFDEKGQSALLIAIKCAIETETSTEIKQRILNFLEFLLVNGLRIGEKENFSEFSPQKNEKLDPNLVTNCQKNPFYCEYFHKILAFCIVKHKFESNETPSSLIEKNFWEACNKALVENLKNLNNTPEMKILLEIMGGYEDVRIIVDLSDLNVELSENPQNLDENPQNLDENPQNLTKSKLFFQKLYPNFIETFSTFRKNPKSSDPKFIFVDTKFNENFSKIYFGTKTGSFFNKFDSESDDSCSEFSFSSDITSKMSISSDTTSKLSISSDITSKSFEVISSASSSSFEVIDDENSSFSSATSNTEAKNNPNLENLAPNLIEKFFCFVILQIFDNNFKPYFKNDRKSKKEFEKITKKIHKKVLKGKIHEKFIQNVFKTQDLNLWHQSLIACVPKICANYAKNEKILEKNRINLQNLFNFYGKLMQDFENHFKIVKISEKIKKVNQISEIADKVSKISENFKWKNLEKFQNLEIFKIIEDEDDFLVNFEIFPEKNSQIIFTNSSILTMCQIFQEKKENFVIFTDFENFKDEIFREDVQDSLKYAHLVVSLKLNNENFEDMNNFEDMKNFEVMKNFEIIKNFKVMKIFCDKFIFVVESNNLEVINDQNFSNFLKFQGKSETIEEIITESEVMQTQKIAIYHKIFHNFSDFDRKTGNFLLSKKVDFQGSLISFSDVLGNKICPFLDEIPINSLINDSKPLKIGQKLVKTEQFYYDRKFIDTFLEMDFKCQNSQIFSDTMKYFEDLIYQKVILLCDEPGMGKTTTLKNLQFKFKRFFPSNWVLYVDLKRHNSIYEDFKDVQEWNFELFTKFFTKIQNLGNFESKIFHQLLKSEKVVFLIDGVDEITMRHKNFVSNFTKQLHRITKCYLWIGMRPYCIDEYRGAFSIFAYHLEPINQVDFLKIFIKSQNLSENEVKYLKKCVENFKNLTKSSENPLCIKIILDIYDELEVDEGYYTMYFKYLWKKFRKGVEKLENSERSQSIKIKKIFKQHQQIAMKKFVDAIQNITVNTLLYRKGLKDLEILQKTLTDDEVSELSNFGIIYGHSTDKTFFIHQTFYEFFVASFLVEKIFGQPGENLYSDQIEMCFELFSYIFIDKNNQIIGKFIDSYIKDNEEKILKQENHKLKQVFRVYDLKKSVILKFIENYFEKNISHTIESKFFNLSKIVLKIFADQPEIDQNFNKISQNLPTFFINFAYHQISSSEALEILKILSEVFDKSRTEKLFGYFLLYIQPFAFLYEIFKILDENDLKKFFLILSEIFTEDQLKFYLNETLNDKNISENFSNIFLLTVASQKMEKFSHEKFEIFYEFFNKFVNIHLKCKSFEILLENSNFLSDFSFFGVVLTISTEIEIREIFVHENYKIFKETLSLVSKKVNVSYFGKLLHLFDVYLDKNEVFEIIESKPNLKIEFSTACVENLDHNVHLFWTFISKILPKPKLKEFLLFRHHSTFTAFHYTLLSPILDFTEYFEKAELKNLLKVKNIENETILFEIYRKEILGEKLVDLLFEIFNENELKKFLNHRNNSGCSAFYVCSDVSDSLSKFSKCPEKLRDFVKNKFEDQEMSIMGVNMRQGNNLIKIFMK